MHLAFCVFEAREGILELHACGRSAVYCSMPSRTPYVENASFKDFASAFSGYARGVGPERASEFLFSSLSDDYVHTLFAIRFIFVIPSSHSQQEQCKNGQNGYSFC